MIGVWYTVRGGVTLVDRATAEQMAGRRWSLDRGGYVRAGSLYLHRLVAGTPNGKHTDHVNGDRLDNRRANLRVCTRAQNNANVAPRARSGFKGVYRQPGATARPWLACITVDGRTRNLGHYATAIEAARAYNRAARKFHGRYARLNVFATQAA